ncbi:MAG: 2-C-methyl-D-erythritol 4-phosphate cytidylyltransferase [Clostridiales bacterium 38-18]|nr:MAG: 2-C-methyl-D-erythritol 4-phosphate cytidylyltransferase [Clostridiales bacterium 38-18]
MTEIKTSAIIPAAGSGTRIGGSIKKQFLKLQGKEVLNWTLEALMKMQSFVEIIVVVPHDEVADVQGKIVKWFPVENNIKVICGGATRQESVYNGLSHLEHPVDLILIHDGVRPFIPKSSTVDALSNLYHSSDLDGLIAGMKVTDTLKKVEVNLTIVETVDRETVWTVQTPQIFKLQTLFEAHKFALQNSINATDDAMLLEVVGKKVGIYEGSADNIKITKPFDVKLAEWMIASKEGEI